MRVIDFLKRTAGAWIPSLICALIVSASLVNADPWAPYGLFITGSATSNAGCTDDGAGLHVVSNTLLCIAPTQLEDLTLSGTGTGLNVTTNALVGGTLGVTGLTTTGAITSSGLHTLSSATPISLTADTSAGATGVQFAVANGTQSTTVPELGITYSSTAGTNGCPDTGSGSTNLMYLFNNSASATHGLRVFCNGSVTIVTSANPGLTVANESVTSTLTAGSFATAGVGTEYSCTATGGCEMDFGATTAPGVIFKENGSSGMSSSAINFEFLGNNSGANTLLTMKGNGNIDFVTGDADDDVGNIRALGNSSGTGEVTTGAAAIIAGNLGIGAVNVGSNGGLDAANSCAVTMSNAVPETIAATNGMACVATSSVATTHTSFQVTFVNTYNTAPICQVSMGSTNANAVFVKTITNAVGSCSWTTSAAAPASQPFNVSWSAGK